LATIPAKSYTVCTADIVTPAYKLYCLFLPNLPKKKKKEKKVLLPAGVSKSAAHIVNSLWLG
jgi:hypothetical protein